MTVKSENKFKLDMFQMENQIAKSKPLKENVKNETKLLECDTCGRCFKGKNSLDQHKLRIHTTVEKCFQCDTCEKSFESPWALKAHLKIHSKEKQVECKLCGKRLKDTKKFI